MARFVIRTLSWFGTLFLEYSNGAFYWYDRLVEKEVVRVGSNAEISGEGVCNETLLLALLLLVPLEIALVDNFLQFRFSFEPLVGAPERSASNLIGVSQGGEACHHCEDRKKLFVGEDEHDLSSGVPRIMRTENESKQKAFDRVIMFGKGKI